MHFSTLAACSVSLLAASVAGHANILSVQGLKAGVQAGPVGLVLGLDPSTPRNGAAIDPNQRDVTIFLQRTMSIWAGCGQSILSGVHKPEVMIPKLAAKGQIAQALAGGQLFMVLHQVNGDGNGPFTCGIDTLATAGKGSFKKIDIAKQVPGQNPTLNAVVTTQFPLIVNIPEDIQCQGTFGSKKNICLIRCQNFAINGPFGGCIPFELVTSLRASFKEKRSEDDVEKRSEDDVEKRSEDDVEKRSEDDVEKRSEDDVEKRDMTRREAPSPDVEPAADDDQIAKMMAKATSGIVQKRDDEDTATEATAEAPAKPATSDVIAALTEGDDVPAAELEKLKATVNKQADQGKLPEKLKTEAKKHKGSKFGWKNKAKGKRPPAAPTKGA
ncbi:hypothetical protein H072_6834 [Dactylellina haptotyla CBS 200.50]|uniref:Uncharacterized protein n=1 Tax=Dactylellina haptotyla (strain CBS 200.50) TaxID=1284197 RepID=S8A970_DACHA|nr:hypothetical protein H072_6834 [Dactylellina haptotyla CBS 200.50]